MPTRYLKESICTSDNLAQLSAEGERFWYRLLVQVDDFGRYDARPPVLRAACFPLQLDRVSEGDIARWLAELEGAGLLYTYRVGTRPYLAIITFVKHNVPRAKFSRYPDPPASVDAGAQPPASPGKRPDPPKDADNCEQLPLDADNCEQFPSYIEDRKAKSESDAKGGAAPAPSQQSPDLPVAVQVYESSGGRYQSGKLADGTSKRDRARQFIAEHIRDDPLSLRLWERVVTNYCAEWSNKSYTVMVNDYYLRGRVPGERRNGHSSGAGTRPNAAQEAARLVMEELAHAATQ